MSRHNDRAWFAEHKTEYDELRAAWSADISRLLAYMKEGDPTLASLNDKGCMYRFYRDTRFSPDKSPYKTYFSAIFQEGGRHSERAGYYLEMGPDDVNRGSGLYGGLWCLDSALLRKVRRAIVDNHEEFAEILSAPALERYYPGWFGESLKRPPKGFADTDPFIDVVKYKNLGRYCPLDEHFFEDPEWPARAAELFMVLKPLIHFINYSITE